MIKIYHNSVIIKSTNFCLTNFHFFLSIISHFFSPHNQTKIIGGISNSKYFFDLSPNIFFKVARNFFSSTSCDTNAWEILSIQISQIHSYYFSSFYSTATNLFSNIVKRRKILSIFFKNNSEDNFPLILQNSFLIQNLFHFFSLSLRSLKITRNIFFT